jgi:hypothetical protein
MSVARLRLASIVPLLAAAAALSTSAVAQVPEGSAVVGTYYNGGTPGVWIVNLQSGALTPITGLPAELTAAGIGQINNKGPGASPCGRPTGRSSSGRSAAMAAR